MFNKIIFAGIGLFFIGMFFVFINRLNKNKETKNKTLYNILGFGFLSFLLLFLVFQKDLASRVKENVKNNKVEKIDNKKKEEPKENKEEIKKEEKTPDVKEEKKTEVEPLVELLNKIKENPYGFGKDYKVIIADGNRYMPNVLYFKIEYAGFKTREYYFAKNETKGTIEVFNSVSKKEFKILEKYGKNDEECYDEI